MSDQPLQKPYIPSGTKVENAAAKLYYFLEENTPPINAGDQEDDWPISIACDEDVNDKLLQLLNELRDELIKRGFHHKYKTKEPYEL